MRLRFAAGVVLCGVAACSSFTPSDPESTPDAGATPEAGADGTTPDAAGAGPFCSTLVPAPTFCVDCEDNQLLTFAFTDTRGSIDIVSTVVYAGAKSIQARGASGDYAYAARTLGKGFTKTLTLSYRVRMSPGDAGANTAIASRVSLGAIPQCVFDIKLSQASAALATGTGTNHAIAGDPGPGRWFGLSLRLAPGSAGYVVAHVLLDGREALAPEEVTTGCPNVYFTELPRLEIGVQSVFVPFEIGFDDVVLSGE